MENVAKGPPAEKGEPWPDPTPEEQNYEAGHVFHGFLVADLRVAFARIVDREDWQKPWKAMVARMDVEKIKAAAAYFHADEPVVVCDSGATVELAGEGLQGW